MTAYSAAYCGNCHAPRNWRFEGSTDGAAWTTLKDHVNDSALSNGGKHLAAYWPVNNPLICTRFRWVTTSGGDAGGSSCFCLHMGAIELYGVLQTPP